MSLDRTAERGGVVSQPLRALEAGEREEDVEPEEDVDLPVLPFQFDGQVIKQLEWGMVVGEASVRCTALSLCEDLFQRLTHEQRRQTRAMVEGFHSDQRIWHEGRCSWSGSTTSSIEVRVQYAICCVDACRRLQTPCDTVPSGRTGQQRDDTRTDLHQTIWFRGQRKGCITRRLEDEADIDNNKSIDAQAKNWAARRAAAPAELQERLERREGVTL